MKTNFNVVSDNSMHQPDRLLDRGDWTWKPEARSKYREIRKALPTPLETRLALQSRLAIAAHERSAWIEANRDKIIAAARAELKSKLNSKLN